MGFDKKTFTAGKDVTVFGLEDNTSIQQLIEHIKEKADIDIRAKDIWLHRSKNARFVVHIGCSSIVDALQLAKTLNLSEFNGSKMVAEVEYFVRGNAQKLKKRGTSVARTKR